MVCGGVGRPGAAPERLTLCLRGQSCEVAAMAVSESQLKKMVSKVRPRRALVRPHAPSAPFRAGPNLARPSPASLPGGRESPVPSSGAFAAPDSEMPVALCRNPDTGPGKVGGGDSQQRRGAEAACHLPLALFAFSLEQSGGQYSFPFAFYKHKEDVVLDSQSGAVLSTLVPVYGCVSLRHSLPARRECPSQFSIPHTQLSDE